MIDCVAIYKDAFVWMFRDCTEFDLLGKQLGSFGLTAIRSHSRPILTMVHTKLGLGFALGDKWSSCRVYKVKQYRGSSKVITRSETPMCFAQTIAPLNRLHSRHHLYSLLPFAILLVSLIITFPALNGTTHYRWLTHHSTCFNIYNIYPYNLDTV